MKLYVAELFILILFIAPFAQAIYIDQDDPRYPDSFKYLDQQDPRLNKDDPATYLDPDDPRDYIPLNQINGVKSTQGNIVLYSSDGSVTILPDYLSSRINLMASGGDSNGLTWAQVSALFPVPDENISSLSWTKLLNYPVGCGANQAVQVIGDTLTCISILSGSGSCDNNTLCTFTGTINTNFNANFQGDVNHGGNVTITDTNTFAFLVETDAGADRFRIDTVSNLVYTSTIRPLSDNGQDLGQPTARFRDAYLGGNIRFDGVLSGGDFNYSLSDANDSQSCPVGQALQSVGNVLTCVSVSSGSDSNKVMVSVNDTNADFLFGKLQAGNRITLTITSPSGAEKIRIDANSDANSANFTGDILGTTNEISVAGGTNKLFGAGDATLSLPKQVIIQELMVQNDGNFTNIKVSGKTILQSVFNFQTGDQNSIVIKNDQNKITFVIDKNGNVQIDGNIFAQDENTFIGNPATGFNDDITFYGRQLVTNPGSNGANMIIGPDTLAFCATPCAPGSESGIKFSATAPRGIKIFGAGNPVIIFGTGAPGVENVVGYLNTRTTNPSGTGLANGWTNWFDKGTVDMNWQWNIRRNGIFQHFNAQMFLGTQNDNIFDANWNGDINHSGDINISNSLDVDENSWFHGNTFTDKNIYGQLISPGTAVGTSCNTVCGGVNYGGPWTCVEALSTAGVASTCADITVAKTCLCRN